MSLGLVSGYEVNLQAAAFPLVIAMRRGEGLFSLFALGQFRSGPRLHLRSGGSYTAILG